MKRVRIQQWSVIAFLVAAFVVPTSAVAEVDKNAISTSLAGGQVQLDFRGQYRARFLFNTGRDFKQGNNVEQVRQRARFGMGLTYKERLGFFFQVQDVRTWGEELHTLNDFKTDGFDLHQAYGQVRIFDRLFVRIGRMELNIDNERLVGAVDWSDPGRSFDGITVFFERDPWHARIFYAKLGEKHTLNNAFKRDKDLGLVYFRYSGFPIVEPSFLYILDTDYAVKRNRHTIGVHVKGIWKGLSYTVEAYGQFGEEGDKTIKAWMVSAEVGYTLPHRWVPVALGADAWFTYLSGDRNPNDGTSKSFNTLFATNHKFYGLMDFFLDLQRDTLNRGLVDAGARIRLAPTKGMFIKIDYHYFRVPRRFSSGEVYLGSEIDILVKYKVWKYLYLDVAYGMFIPGSAMKQLKDSGNEHQIYMTADFRF